MTGSARVDRPVARLARALRARDVGGARVAIVLGSGLGGLAERVERARTIAYPEIDAMPASTVPGHQGRLVVGELAGVRVLVQSGRVHLYEGRTVEEVTRAVRAFVAIGCRAVLLTNAAGGLRREWEPGTLMRVADHVNLQGETPLSSASPGARTPYDAALGRAIDRAASESGIELASGVYAGMRGPSYETAAEVRMLASIGVDAVGMSTVAEALAAHAAGARVAAISCITNRAAGLGSERLSHDDVLATGKAAAQRLTRLVERSIARIGDELGG